ncbi:hypothetical protein IG197_02625 [Aminobacter sp. SR38]|nr:hypothetical protein IG197_02625 [Aminobacter sp. SR38]
MSWLCRGVNVVGPTVEGEVECRGAEAIERTRRLRLLKTDPENWTNEYVDDKSGDVWLLDYPDPETHGGGPPRIRKIRPKGSGDRQ